MISWCPDYVNASTHSVDTLWVDADHHTEPSERRVLLLVILNLPKGGAPSLGKFCKTWSNEVRSDKTQPTDCHRRVLRERLGRLGVEQDRDQPSDQRRNEGLKRSCVSLVLKGNLTHGPGGIVADGYALWGWLDDDLFNNGGHDGRNDWLEEREARDSHITEESVSGLPDRRLVMLYCESNVASRTERLTVRHTAMRCSKGG
jgi:hypothetical protein